LKCWYDRESNPAWIINPLKKELLSKSPRIVQIYEFLSDKIISQLVTPTRGGFDYGSSSIKVNWKQPKPNLERTSIGRHLDSGSTPEFNRRLEFLTGLDATEPLAAEQVKVNEYTFGGQFLTHRDSVDIPEVADSSQAALPYQLQRGNRISTVLLYVSLVYAY
jgi:hypothetical protein